jgi:hypothetical protein
LYRTTQRLQGDAMQEQTHDDILTAAIVSHTQRYSTLFAEQVRQAKAKNVPVQFTYPEPANDIEREALRLFFEELAQILGVPIPEKNSHSTSTQRRVLANIRRNLSTNPSWCAGLTGRE